MIGKLEIVADESELARAAADRFVAEARSAIADRGRFVVALAGGSTPKVMFDLLSATPRREQVAWENVRFYFGDERCVPPDDPSSNFGMANRTMLSKLALRPEQIHRMRGEDEPAQAALEYERELRAFFHIEQPGDFPRFNLLLLGLGENAHVASLFPRHPALHEETRLAVAVVVEAAPSRRISLTMPVINSAERVMFLVSGENKAAAVKNILRGPADPEQYPAQLVNPHSGKIVWLMDKAAASALE